MNTSTTRRVALVLAMLGLLLFGLVGLAGRATFAAPAADKGGDGPYVATPLDVTVPGAPLQVVVRPSGSYSVYRNNIQQFYGGYAEGVYLWVNGVVWGPEQVPAGHSVNQYTQVSNTLSGAGTRANPWIATTVLDVGNTGLRLTQQVSYVNGDEYIRNNWALCVTSGAGYNNLHLFHAADLYTGGNDRGYGYYDPATGAIGGYTQARDLYQIFIPITGGSRYEEELYFTVWDNIGDAIAPGGGFHNFYRPNDYIDNGAGLEYVFNLLVGCNSISDFVSFSNQPIIPGQTPTPTPQARRDANVTVSLLQDPDRAVPPGGIFIYTVKVTNHGPGWAYDTSVRIPLDPNVEVLDFISSESNGYVDYVGTDAVSVMFRHLEPDEGAQARIVARVRPEAAANLKISSQAQVSWDDTRIHRTWNSNTITMLVGATRDSGFHGLQQPMLTVPTEPVAAGTPILIGGDFFGQEERVTLWINVPGGDVVDLSESDYEIADMDGFVAFFVGTTTSAPAGTYSVVAHGLSTGVEGVGTFTIK